MDDETLLLEAIRLAEVHSASGVNGPFGSVVARHGEVVGRGWNQVVERRDPTAHAEVVAIRDAAATLGTHVLADCTLYSSCEPCPMCLAAAYWAHIPRVVFAAGKEDAAAAGFDDAFIYVELAHGWPERRVEAEQRLADAGRRVFQLWADNDRRVKY